MSTLPPRTEVRQMDMACSTLRWASLSACSRKSAGPWTRAKAPTVGRGGPCLSGKGTAGWHIAAAG
jgi:hypothetical protein